MMARVSMIVPAAFAMTFMWVGQAEEFSPQQERIALAFLDLAKCFVDSHKKVGELTLAVANKVISNLEHLFLVIYILELLLALAMMAGLIMVVRAFAAKVRATTWARRQACEEEFLSIQRRFCEVEQENRDRTQRIQERIVQQQ